MEFIKEESILSIAWNALSNAVKNEAIKIKKLLFILGDDETMSMLKGFSMFLIDNETDHPILHRCPTKDRAKQNIPKCNPLVTKINACLILYHAYYIRI